MFACLGAHLIGFLRWRLMVCALDIPFTNFDAIRIGFIGLFFNLFAFGVIGGDTLRAFYVTRQVKERVAEAMASVLADRLIGMLTMFSVASVAFFTIDTNRFPEHLVDNLSAIQNVCKVAFFFSIAGILGIFVLFGAPWLTQIQFFKCLVSIPKIGSVLQKLTDVLLVYRRRPGAMFSAFLLSLGVNFCFAVSIFSLGKGLTNSSPEFTSHFVIEPIAMVCNAIPLPGGIGGMELAMKFLYEAFAANNGVIVGFAFRVSLLIVSAIGAVFWFWNRKSVEALSCDSDRTPLA